MQVTNDFQYPCLPQETNKNKRQLRALKRKLSTFIDMNKKLEAYRSEHKNINRLISLWEKVEGDEREESSSVILGTKKKDPLRLWEMVSIMSARKKLYVDIGTCLDAMKIPIPTALDQLGMESWFSDWSL